jgi:hypothetical protein
LSTPLNDLTHRLALLEAVSGCTLTVRLLGGEHGDVIELKATRTSAAEACDYARKVTLRALTCRGARQLAADFVREARLAFATGRRPAGRTALRAG